MMAIAFATTRPSSSHARGSMLIVALLIMAVLSGMVLVLARDIRVESLAATNTVASRQATAIAFGAIEAVMRIGDTMPGDAVSIGEGGVWLIRPNFDDDELRAWGIVDEASKLDLNTASREQLMALPHMTANLASAIIDWRDADETVSEEGAESDYYLSLDSPYQAKNADFETVEELLLVRGMTALELYGEDANRNGILDENEDDGDTRLPPDDQDGELDRGLIDFVTVYASSESASGLTDVNSSGGGGGRNGGGQSGDSLQTLLTDEFGTDRGNVIMGNIIGGRPHRNMVDLYLKSKMTGEEFAQVADKLTAGSAPNQQQARTQVNINTAPSEVLVALGIIDEATADRLVSHRQTLGVGLNQGSSSATDPLAQTVAWVTEVLDREQAVSLGDFITSQSGIMAADIVAVSPGGKAFERYRVVFDQSGDTPKVLYKQRLTHLGWPLDWSILESLRSGESVDDLVETSDRGNF